MKWNTQKHFYWDARTSAPTPEDCRSTSRGPNCSLNTASNTNFGSEGTTFSSVWHFHNAGAKHFQIRVFHRHMFLFTQCPLEMKVITWGSKSWSAKVLLINGYPDWVFHDFVNSCIQLCPFLVAPVKPTEVLVSVRAWLLSQVLYISPGYFESMIF